MKRSITLAALILAIVIMGCSARTATITLTNPSEVDLVEKGITVERAAIDAKGIVLKEGQLLFLSHSGKLTPCQTDDLNGDGNWDELFALVDLKAGESKTFNLVVKSKEKGPAIVQRTNIRFADKNDASIEFATKERLKSNTTEISQTIFQFEGPGWENDMVAFRNYFDARNGIDIFGKKTNEMILDQCGLKDGPTYHEMQPWGMDILKVANSLGAGAIALQTDSGLYRIGPDCKGTFTLVKEGALRSILDLDFEGMRVEGKSVNIKHRISIEAGKPWYKSEVSVSGIDNAKLVTGIVNLHADSVFSGSTGSAAYMYTHDNQAYNGEKLGMAVLVAQNSMVVTMAPEEGPGITQTFYTALPIDEKPTTFAFMAGWELQDSRWATKEGFEQGVKEQAAAFASIIEIQ